MTWADIKFFQSNEFDSPDVPGSGLKMNLDFVAKLDRIRSKLKQPMFINSGFRTPEHNARVGGVDSSSHEIGRAADIRTPSAAMRHQLITLAFAEGISRIGIGQTFVHLDSSEHHPQQVVWVYPASRKA